ncbi:MAG TPA: NADH-quinone oxidoreductase subunit M [Porphyromonadaceae bacterium]|jgi:NADH-quinone oxidoreductase subunit M|uniref:NADH-quinone oxidoreductase subunit M n=1 Tax=Candidatus Caccoplasma intestinavium TaxID=2840716 RepID=A0A9D1GFP1_9BACT|nr:NADH-quinone oxidoreductase subunit M [Coprobacter sp.]CDA21082.1 proton-translocating NADH-quinone oxidoreductase chain M [Bacteroides sp. CAG:144]HCZ21186.1 NADH-quinone oxidoreductase subunit M [Porphyromonadaceae bacterium]HIT39389.1 NADH-quinone oxidoreductase subunit M [Candidatus Caccoplasma intestinavium]
MNFLSLFVLIPLLMMAGLALSKEMKQIRAVAVIGSSLQLVFAFIVLFMFLGERAAGNTAEMLFVADTVWYAPLDIHYTVGVDGVSVAMLLLSAIVVFAGVFASWKIDPLPKEFFLWLILLSIGVFGFFISINLFTMFMFYEIALIPMYLLIGVWGSGNKTYSAMKLTLMLMGGSALLLIGILGIYFHSSADGNLTMNILEIAKNNAIPHDMQYYLFPLTFVGFGVLGAMFPFHTWSPDGHASAPTAVSMLHAGVLMKLGGYGCFRVAMYLMPWAATELSWIFLILTGISVVYGAFSACVQTDLKYINAYSSVSHCGLVLFALLMWNTTAMTGAVLQMLSHGLMTALFFALIGMIYGRTHTRDIREMGGLMKIMPFLSACYVIAGLASLGLPGLSGFVAEMTVFVGSFQWSDPFHRVFTIVACTSIVITAVYILRVVGKLLYGKVQNEHHRELTDAVWYERLSAITLIVGVAAIGMAPGWISNLISDSMSVISERILQYI